MNIMEGMYSSRFKAGQDPNNKAREKKAKEDEEKMPMVLRNLKNGS